MSRAGPSRSQPSRYHSQRVRERRAESENEDDSDNEIGNQYVDDDLDAAQPGRTQDGDSGDHLDKKARDLVRLALFSEHKRVPLRREDINKKVLGSYTRSFNAVLFKAQALLRKTFAMELVELQTRNSRDQDSTEGPENATGVKRKAAATGSRTYILRSVLDPTIIEQAALSDERLLEEELAEGLDDNDEDDMPRNYGSIIAWSTADQLAALGLLHVILALILVNGRAISELDLRANLKRLRITPNGTIPFNAQAAHHSMSIDTFLQHLVRQGYLDRVHLGDTKSTTGKRRARVSATQGNGNAEENPQAYEWRWGSRAHGEVGEQAVARFVGGFMVERTRMGDVEEEEEEGGGGSRRRGKQKQKEGDLEKRLETVVKAIERAAGGGLTSSEGS